MSDGLIWAGIGKGLADAGSTMGQFLFKDLLAKEDREYKAATRAEELRLRMEDRERDRELRREIAAGRDSGGGGQGGLKAEDYAPGGKLAGMIAGKMGMTEPEYAAYYGARKSGDMTPFMQESTSTVMDDEFGEQKLTTKSLPAGFEKEFKSKIKALADIEESYALGGRYDDVAKGRKTEFQTGTAQGVLSGAIKAGKGGEAVAVSEGKPLIDVKGGEKFSQYTGESETTPLGKSEIQENKAQAGKYGKEIEKIQAEIDSGSLGKNSRDRLTTMINSANATIKSLNDGSKGNTPEAKADWQRQYDDAVALRDKATSMLKGTLEEKSPTPPKPTPGAGSGAAAEKAPSIADVQGAPAGSSIGARTEKGWEVKDKSGKLLGYVRGKK